MKTPQENNPYSNQTTDAQTPPDRLEQSEKSEKFDVILPAGGRITGEFAQRTGVEIKALIDFCGETILRRTIHTLRATNRVGRIVVIGPQPALNEAQKAGANGLIIEGESGPDNILRGLQWLQEEGRRKKEEGESEEVVGDDEASSFLLPPSSFDLSSRVLIVTTDLPFLTTQALNTFLDACAPDAEAVIPILTQREFEARFPGTQNEYVRLKEGNYTIGCAFVVNGETLLRNEAHLRAVFEARKSQWQMARLVGWATIFRFVTRQLTVPLLQARISAIARCKGVALPHMPPELAYDIDQPADFLYACVHAAQQTDRLLSVSPERPQEMTP
jgi:GTP:adenosylcobinamide-phosphate guanylyltransferase